MLQIKAQLIKWSFLTIIVPIGGTVDLGLMFCGSKSTDNKDAKTTSTCSSSVSSLSAHYPTCAYSKRVDLGLNLLSIFRKVKLWKKNQIKRLKTFSKCLRDFSIFFLIFMFSQQNLSKNNEKISKIFIWVLSAQLEAILAEEHPRGPTPPTEYKTIKIKDCHPIPSGLVNAHAVW